MELFTLEGEVNLRSAQAVHHFTCSYLDNDLQLQEDLHFAIENIRGSLQFCNFFLKVCLAFGALILFAGLIVVLVGYATPARIEAFGEDDLLFVDR